jgi:hypothetical protein
LFLNYFSRRLGGEESVIEGVQCRYLLLACCHSLTPSLTNCSAITHYSTPSPTHSTAYSIMANYQTPESKKQEFRKYLEKSGVIDAFTKGE